MRCVNSTNEKLFDFGGNSEVKMVNNYDWTHEINIIEFYVITGKTLASIAC